MQQAFNPGTTRSRKLFIDRWKVTMLPKPKSINTVGLVQFFLAASFVVWLLFRPDTGINFAWPVVPRLTAMFLGTGFILRTFLGYQLWREKTWHRLRWMKWGNFMFLGVLFLATFWHLEEMNWKPNIVVAHIWVVAYVVEPLILFLIEPHGAESNAPVPVELSEGPVSGGLKSVLVGIFIVGVTIAALLFINPPFADTRWPWPLDEFDARIMAAWPAACAVWAVTMYFAKDWAEIKMGMQTLIVYAVPLFIVWLITFPQYDPARENGWTYGVATGLAAASLIFFYWRQEAFRRKPVKSPQQVLGN
jgi:hypothetical protein